MHSASDIITFWFTETRPEDWFGGKPEFDAIIDQRFRTTHERVALGEAFSWRVTPSGRLAEIIVLDQFSRQLHRGSARAFASDTMALALAQEAVAGEFDSALTPEMRSFLYMPYMHSESLRIHDQAMTLFGAMQNPEQLKYERDHYAIIERFGRFPMRNVALGRTSTPEEASYIAERGGNMF